MNSLSSNIRDVVDLRGAKISLLPQVWELAGRRLNDGGSPTVLGQNPHPENSAKPCRSARAARGRDGRAAAPKPDTSVVPETPRVRDLLPVPGRSSASWTPAPFGQKQNPRAPQNPVGAHEQREAAMGRAAAPKPDTSVVPETPRFQGLMRDRAASGRRGSPTGLDTAFLSRLLPVNGKSHHHRQPSPTPPANRARRLPDVSHSDECAPPQPQLPAPVPRL